VHRKKRWRKRHLAEPLLPRLAPPHILQGRVEPLVRLDQILQVAHQLHILRVRQAVGRKR
jgi:hypothetical protein